LLVLTLEQKTFLIESYFRNGLKVNGSWIYSVQNCLEEFPNVIVDRKTFEDNLSRCVKLFRETGGVYRRKTTGRSLKRTAAVIETAREIMQNAPHPSIRQDMSIHKILGPIVQITLMSSLKALYKLKRLVFG
jgi:hypothetical protein